MRPTRRLAFRLVVLVACAVPSATLADGIDGRVREQMRVSHVPAAAVAVVRAGRVVKLKAYGTADVEWGRRATAHTRFQLASATKIFTGVLLMRLVEQGRVGLDDPLTRWFPEAPPRWAGISVRQLANHSSGLAEDLGSPRPSTVAGVVAAAEARPLAFAPGSEARYGFTDFTVLRAVIERASGQTLPHLLRAEVTEPLAMRDTGFAMAEDDGEVRTGAVLPRRAAIYAWSDSGLRTSDFFFAPEGYGAGGLYSSAADVATFFAALDAGRVLKRSSVEALETPATLRNGRRASFDVGWVTRTYRGRRVVGHSGGPALADILRLEDRKLTVIALTNLRTFYPLLAEAVLDRCLPPTPQAPAIPDARPSLTRRTEDALTTGGANPDAFAAEGASSAEALRSPFGRALLEGVGPLRGIEALSEASGEFRYRVVFARKTMVWVVTADGADRIRSLRPE